MFRLLEIRAAPAQSLSPSLPPPSLYIFRLFFFLGCCAVYLLAAWPPTLLTCSCLVDAALGMIVRSGDSYSGKSFPGAGTGNFETPSGGTTLLANSVVNAIAAKLGGKSPAQILIRWSVQSGYVSIPKSTKAERIRQNGDVFSWSIPDEVSGPSACRLPMSLVHRCARARAFACAGCASLGAPILFFRPRIFLLFILLGVMDLGDADMIALVCCQLLLRTSFAYACLRTRTWLRLPN